MLSMLRNPTGRRGLRRPSGAGLADRRTSNEVLSIARDLLRGQVTMDMSLMEAGLDSFGAMEFQSRLSDRLGGPKLPATLIFDHPTLRQLEAYIAGEQESREQLATAKDGAQVGVPDAAMVADALKGLVAPSLGVAGAEEIATVRLTGASLHNSLTKAASGEWLCLHSALSALSLQCTFSTFSTRAQHALL